MMQYQQATQLTTKLMPGAPLLEQAMSQKQFIIKHKGGGGGAKSKQRGKSTKAGHSTTVSGGATTTNGLMRAYFPNLIAKKDVTMISPTAMTAQFST